MLTGAGFSYKLKDNVYTPHVRSCCIWQQDLNDESGAPWGNPDSPL